MKVNIHLELVAQTCKREQKHGVEVPLECSVEEVVLLAAVRLLTIVEVVPLEVGVAQQVDQ